MDVGHSRHDGLGVAIRFRRAPGIEVTSSARTGVRVSGRPLRPMCRLPIRAEARSAKLCECISHSLVIPTRRSRVTDAMSIFPLWSQCGEPLPVTTSFEPSQLGTGEGRQLVELRHEVRKALAISGERNCDD